MTAADWFAGRDPGPLLDALGTEPTARKRRLFLCACCRRVQTLDPHVWPPSLLDTAERFADGHATDAELQEAHRQAGERLNAAYRRVEVETGGIEHPARSHAGTLAQARFAALCALRAATAPHLTARRPARDAAHAVGGLAAAQILAGPADEWQVSNAALTAIADEEAAQADLVRDLFADRVRFVVPHPDWFTSDVMALANHVDETGAFELLPILADALQDAGCDSEELLAHCRAEGATHARGCWAIDLIMGRM